jgi:hypothetical protein
MSHLNRGFAKQSDLIKEFRLKAELFSKILGEEGISVRPFDSPELLHFSILSSEQQLCVLRTINHSLGVFAEMKEAGESLRDSPRLLWRSLRHLGWRPRSDVFDKIEDEDVIEVYSAEKTGLFRNLVFYENVSYSIEDLFSRSVFELTWREPRFVELSMGVFERVFSGEVRETIAAGIEKHLLRETSSPEKLELMIDLKWISPLHIEGELGGILAVSRFEMLSR